jgi:hypothetical protein
MEQGLLDLAVELSARNITAGADFALYMVVTNPFSNPIWVHEVNVTLPTDLQLAQDLESQRRAKRNAELSETKHQEGIAEMKAQHDDLRTILSPLLEQVSSLNRHLENVSDTALKDELHSAIFKLRHAADKIDKTIFGSAELIVNAANVDHIVVGSKTTHMILGEGSNIKKVELFEPWQLEAEKSRLRTVELRSSLPENAALQPGSTAVYTAIIRAKRSITFAPATYRLQFFVNYSFDSPRVGRGDQDTPTTKLLTNRIAHELAIRPPIYAVILGAVVGGIIGSMARLLQLRSHMGLIDASVSVFVAMILSGMAVVFLARKSDAQSFVSVEDFWGGMLMGFLVGYTGTSFFGTLTGISPATSTK